MVCLNSWVVNAEFLKLEIAVEGLEPIQVEEIYEGFPIEYTVFTDYDVFLYSAQIVDFDSFIDSRGGEFEALITSEQDETISQINFVPKFMIFSNPPEETDFDIVTLQFPYSYNMKSLKINWNNPYTEETIEKLSVDISELLCNNDGTCNSETGENYYSCPQDCPWYAEDNMCLGYSGDKFCDLDCYEDDDCTLGSCNQGTYSGEECTAEGNCFDGLKNADEEGTDCGGRCLDLCKILSLEEIINDWFNDFISVENTLQKIKDYIALQ